ncbi:MAG: Asp23/Gls24 family envelope stress response protein [Clostridia bacterium]|nr:Asp23/Gls24 family envelope stress response protein [Clostridia bacterium]MDD4047254.1 Asp23/Gls24 family envelope stress response protein [Clostridia bacterium]
MDKGIETLVMVVMVMEVYALVGSSGTGKSHRAMTIAYKHGIDTVIDDGLLIKDGYKVTGKSAKREATTLKAVKRAIFLDHEHARDVQKSLKEINASKILVLGTSLRMVLRITKTLELPEPTEVIHIEDVATEKEIKLALEYRNNHGMHVIPVPTIEVKKDFPGYLVDPLKYFFKKKNESRHKIGEKSIIRPKFSYIGKLLISENVVSQIVTYVVIQNPGVSQVNKVLVNMQEEGVTVRIEITALYGYYLPDIAKEVRKVVCQELEGLTGLIVYGVHIIFKSLTF